MNNYTKCNRNNLKRGYCTHHYKQHLTLTSYLTKCTKQRVVRNFRYRAIVKLIHGNEDNNLFLDFA